MLICLSLCNKVIVFEFTELDIHKNPFHKSGHMQFHKIYGNNMHSTFVNTVNTFMKNYVYLYIVIEAQLVPKNTTLIRTIVFPDDTMSEKFNRTQITIPRSALIHQRQTES